ncbi:MAG TPA: penicillin-binding protein 1A [Bacillota bacterium]|nr:penicillin-binding protein 1A [Bacillota bacterium]HOL08585.1 penicillin-binding protein 1A [Bacillota bacterium]HPO97801.1 penicillin-binding protein 1A [Bacillota bacterium]
MRSKKQTRSTARTSRISAWTITLTVLVGIIVGFFVILMIHIGGPGVEILPPPKRTTIFYDINKREYSRIFIENRLEIPLHQMPDYMKKAIINVEDARFYEHSGIDLIAIARAIWIDIKGGALLQGGSTITQQLARNVLLTQKKELSRKLQEVLLAMKIERNYTKDEILERYLNQIYFGHGAYGVEAASRMYFGKSVTELDLHQIALIAGLPKNPHGYSPYVNPDKAKERRAVVLNQMVKYGTISQQQAEIYKNKPLDVIPQTKSQQEAAYFTSYVIQKLKNRITEEALYTGGYKIYTTLDPAMQKAAEEAVANLTGGTADKQGVLQPQIALVALDPQTGHIKAMIGGRNFANTQLNRAVAAYRQPGSAIKPFVYTAAIDSGRYHPGSIMDDEPVKFGRYAPQNYDRKFRGKISLRHALEASVNTIAVKLVDELGPSTIARYAKQMGLTSLVLSGSVNDLNLASLGLGGLTKGVTPLELTAAYVPFANKGIWMEPIAILEVRDADGNLLFEEHSQKRVALREETAYQMTDMLRGVISRGTGRAAAINRPAAGKTGTSSDYTNAWFVGYTPELVATVWIGNDSQKIPVRLNGAYVSSSRAAQIWGIFMRKALAGTPITDFKAPEGLIASVSICSETGQLATPFCPDVRYESFISDNEPTEKCELHGIIIEEEPNNQTPNNLPDNINDPETNVKPPLPGIIQQPKPAPSPQTAPQPRKRIMVRICTESGLIATAACPDSVVVSEMFVEGEEPRAHCNIHN